MFVQPSISVLVKQMSILLTRLRLLVHSKKRQWYCKPLQGRYDMSTARLA